MRNAKTSSFVSEYESPRVKLRVWTRDGARERSTPGVTEPQLFYNIYKVYKPQKQKRRKHAWSVS